MTTSYYDALPVEVICRGGELDGCHVPLLARDFEREEVRWLTYRMPDGELVGDWYLLHNDESGAHASWRRMP